MVVEQIFFRSTCSCTSAASRCQHLLWVYLLLNCTCGDVRIDTVRRLGGTVGEDELSPECVCICLSLDDLCLCGV